MKFLIYGVNGWIGSKVFKQLQENNNDVVAGNCRVDNVKDLEEEILKVNTTHVI
jgi:nucleoside-diphosphate-sugar epimerase